MVINNWVGRLTFTRDMAEGILWLLGYREGSTLPAAPAAHGTYNLTGEGRAASWAEVAREVFELANGSGGAVRPVTTAEYYAKASGSASPRPEHSAFDLAKIEAAGFTPRDWEDELRDYVRALRA